MVQTGKNWITDYISLFCGVYPSLGNSSAIPWSPFVVITNISSQVIPDSSFSIKRIYQSEAHLIELRIEENNPFSCCLFQDGGGNQLIIYNVICFLILRHQDIPKNVRVFWKLFFHRSTNQDKPARTVALKNSFFIG